MLIFGCLHCSEALNHVDQETTHTWYVMCYKNKYGLEFGKEVRLELEENR